MPRQRGGACGARQRRAPTGAAAKGISRKRSTSPVRAPARRPCAIVAAGAVSAAATDTDPVSIAAPNSAAITNCRIAPPYPSRPAAGGRGRERDLERNASFDADDARLAVPVERRRLRAEGTEQHQSDPQSLMG